MNKNMHISFVGILLCTSSILEASPLSLSVVPTAQNYKLGENVDFISTLSNKTNSRVQAAEAVLEASLYLELFQMHADSTSSVPAQVKVHVPLSGKDVWRLEAGDSRATTNSLITLWPQVLDTGKYFIQASYKSHYSVANDEVTPVVIQSAPAVFFVDKPDDSSGAYALYIEARNYRRNQEYGRATEKYAEAIDKKPTGEWVAYMYYDYAWCLKFVNHDKKACITAYKKVVSLFPESTWAEKAKEEITRINRRHGRIISHENYLKQVQAVFRDPDQADAAKAYKAVIDESDILKKISMNRKFINDFPDSFLVQEALFQQVELCQSAMRLLERYSTHGAEELKTRFPNSHRAQLIRD